MDQLWSPWRSDYVSNYDSSRRPSEDETSLFTRLAEDGNDEENLILWRGEQVFVIMNLHPYNNGHLLIVPFREVRSFTDLKPQERAAVADTIDRCMRWLDTALNPDGYNVGINQGRSAGASIEEHLHVHVVPRWDRDANFMTSTAQTRVLPEDLSTTYQKLRRVITESDSQSDGAREPEPAQPDAP